MTKKAIYKDPSVEGTIKAGEIKAGYMIKFDGVYSASFDYNKQSVEVEELAYIAIGYTKEEAKKSLLSHIDKGRLAGFISGFNKAKEIYGIKD